MPENSERAPGAPIEPTLRIRLTSAAAAGSWGVYVAQLGWLVAMPGLFVLSIVMTLRGLVDLWHGEGAAAIGVVMFLFMAWAAMHLFLEVLRLVVRPTAVVGADGVAIHSLGRTRFIPYATVASVERRPTGVLLKATSPKSAFDDG